MKDASGIMYTIGKVFNIIGLVFITLGLIIPIIILANPEEIYNQQQNKSLSVEAIRTMGIIFLIVIIVAIIIEIAVICLATYAKKKLKNDTVEKAPHIIMIVIGVFGSNIFYLIGGILGLVAEEQNNN